MLEILMIFAKIHTRKFEYINQYGSPSGTWKFEYINEYGMATVLVYVLKYPSTGWRPVLVYVLKLTRSWLNIGDSYGISQVVFQ